MVNRLLELLVLMCVCIPACSRDETGGASNDVYPAYKAEADAVLISAETTVNAIRSFSMSNCWAMPQRLDKETLGRFYSNPDNYDENGLWIYTGYFGKYENVIFKWEIIDNSTESYTLILNLPKTDKFWILRYAEEEKSFFLYRLQKQSLEFPFK